MTVKGIVKTSEITADTSLLKTVWSKRDAIDRKKTVLNHAVTPNFSILSEKVISFLSFLLPKINCLQFSVSSYD
jgi:hypothetical protein